ncbi:MAG TPA: hypothetical protein VIX89_19755 [Bryobacteraceae bacterium]
MTTSGFTFLEGRDPVVVLDRVTRPLFEKYAERVLAEFPEGLRTVVVLVPWQAAPVLNQRTHGAVHSFACTPTILEDLLAIDPACPPEHLCYSLLEAMLNGNITVDRVVVRQLPFPEHFSNQKVDPVPASLIMAHRGRPGYLQASLHYLSKANGLDVRVRVGLDGEEPGDYDALAKRFPRAEFFNLQPALGPYVIRQELALRSTEPLLAFHDSDDISCTDRFSALYREMRRTRAELIGSHELRVDEITREVLALRFPLDATEGLRRCYGHALLHPTSLVTREGFFNAGGFSTIFGISCDMQFLMRCYFKLRIRNVDGFFYIRRRHPAALTVAPNTNMEAPMRLYLTRCWEKNFDAVKGRRIALDQSALRQMSTTAKYELRALRLEHLVGHTHVGWHAGEVAQTDAMRCEIEACTARRRVKAATKHIQLRLSDSTPWLDGLQEASRAVLVRQLFNALRLDEHRPFRWRLEHKLVQSIILDAYLPGVAPVTRGLSRLVSEYGVAGLRNKLDELFPNGYFVKRALSDSSGDRGNTGDLEEALATLPNSVPSIADEEWIVQERIPIDVEFRVHSLQDGIVEDLTFRRYVRGDIPGERGAPNRYVQSLLDRLPAGIIAGTLCGWDVARTPAGKFRIIEVNLTGFHPVYRPGFQVSGFFVNLDWGAKSTAQLMRFVEKRDRLWIDAIVDVDVESKERAFYDDVNRWKQRLALEETTGGLAPNSSTSASQYPRTGARASNARYGKGSR